MTLGVAGEEGAEAEERRAAWSRCLLVRRQRTPPSPSPLRLYSALPPAFIGRASKWHSAYEKDPVFMPRKLAYRRPPPPRLISQKHPHICATSREGRPSSAGSLPFLSALASLSPLTVPFSPLNYGCEGRRRRRWRRGGVTLDYHPPAPHVLLLQKSWYTSKSWSLIFYIKPFFNQEDESSNDV